MIDSISEVAAASLANAAKPVINMPAQVTVSLNDVARFEAAMNPATQSSGSVQSMSSSSMRTAGDGSTVRAVFDPLDRINNMSENFMINAEALSTKTDISPGDMLMTMVNVQKFMLQCQAASSVANRTSDGIQELFKQQS